jgi:radical SAM superfamily enzyme
MGDWSKLRNEGLHNLYCLPDVISMAKLRRDCITHEIVDLWTESCDKKTEVNNESLGARSLRRENLDCINLAQDTDQWWLLRTR